MTRDHRIYRIVFVAFIAAVVALAWYYQRRLVQETQNDAGAMLVSLRDTSIEALHGWADSCMAVAEHVKMHLDQRELSDALTHTRSVPEWVTAPEHGRLQQVVAGAHTWADVDDYQLIGADNRILSAGDSDLVGQPAGSPMMADFLDQVRGGRRAFTANTSIDERASAPGIYAYTPLDDGLVLALQFRPTAPVLNLLIQARPGRTGESYLFDRQGLMLTDSRFRDQLQRMGLLEPGQQAAMNLYVRDPGADLTEGAPIQGSLRHLPLTRMAAAATRGESGINLEGYRDYRGVTVVGAWDWIEEYGLGITAEMNRDEALRVASIWTFAIIGIAASLILLITLLYVALAMLRRLREQHRLVESVVEALPGMFFMLNADGEAVRWNRAVTEAMDDPPEQGLKLPLEFWVRGRHKPRVRELIGTALKDGSASFETDFEFRNRLTKPCYVHAVRVRFGEDTCLLVVALEITELKRTQHELAEARSRAEAASVAKSRFLANMSHEIRTPLNGVIGMLELMAEAPEEEDRKNYLNICQASAELLLQVISDILNISEIEAGKLELKQAPFELNAMLERVFGAFASQAREKSLELSRDIAPEVPSSLVGDAGRLSQVLLNLVGNAVKFTHEGEVAVSAQVVERRDHRVRLAFEVRDTGIGIPRNRQRTIFEPFEQQDTSTSRPYGGTGLGLTISRSLVELMGGSIDVHSEPGVGSTFRFTVWLGTELA